MNISWVFIQIRPVPTNWNCHQPRPPPPPPLALCFGFRTIALQDGMIARELIDFLPLELKKYLGPQNAGKWRFITSQEVKVDQTLPLGRIGNSSNGRPFFVWSWTSRVKKGINSRIVYMRWYTLNVTTQDVIWQMKVGECLFSKISTKKNCWWVARWVGGFTQVLPLWKLVSLPSKGLQKRKNFAGWNHSIGWGKVFLNVWLLMVQKSSKHQLIW